MGNIEIKRISVNDIDQLQQIGRQTFYETFSAGNTEKNIQFITRIRRNENNMIKCINFILMFFLTQTVFAGTIDFWDIQRKGANFFPNNPRSERFQDAAKAGILLGRLAPNKWLNGRTEVHPGDFLLGPKNAYTGIVEEDLKYLIQVLDDANRAGIKIVLTMLSLPGSRWLQHNYVNGKYTQQYDLWRNFQYHNQAASFWRELAKALKNHPAIVGYNIINEPCPERAYSTNFRDWYTMDYNKWYKGIKGTPADLNLFYKTVIKAIREVDKETPIVLDAGFYANPYALQILDPTVIQDNKIIYSIHNYEPSRFLSKDNTEQYRYPGNFPTGELDSPHDKDAQLPYAPIEYWDKEKIRLYFQVVKEWMKKYHIPANRIYVGEFGGNRQAPGLIDYFNDLITFMNENKWHWSFYAYREDDGFPMMDYELGTNDLSEKYWKSSVDYTCEKDGIYKPNSLWTVIINGLK